MNTLTHICMSATLLFAEMFTQRVCLRHNIHMWIADAILALLIYVLECNPASAYNE